MKEERSSYFVKAVFLLAIIAVSGGAILTVMATAHFQSNDPANGWVYFGVAVSLFGLSVAAAIFVEQDRASTTSNRNFSDVLQALHESVERGARESQERDELLVNRISSLGDRVPSSEDEIMLAALPADEADQDEDEYQAGVAEVADGRDGKKYHPGEIPLYVIADLIWGWRREQDHEPTPSRRWAVSQLRGAYRASGKGNNPWIVTFSDSRGETRVFRMYRGGKGSNRPTVREITNETLTLLEDRRQS